MALAELIDELKAATPEQKQELLAALNPKARAEDIIEQLAKQSGELNGKFNAIQAEIANRQAKAKEGDLKVTILSDDEIAALLK